VCAYNIYVYIIKSNNNNYFVSVKMIEHINILNSCWILNWKPQGDKPNACTYFVRVNNHRERGYLLFLVHDKRDHVYSRGLDNIYFWKIHEGNKTERVAISKKKREREDQYIYIWVCVCMCIATRKLLRKETVIREL
jgi:hypothetical protein